MAFPTYDSSMQDAIALRLFGNTYSNLKTVQKSAIDGGSTTPTIGHAFDAFNKLKRYALFVAGTGSATSDIPADWLGWFLAEIVARAAEFNSPDRARSLQEEALLAMREAIGSYVVTDADDGTSTAGLSNTKLNIRKFVLHTCLHQPDMLLPSPDVIDAGIREVLQRVWYRQDWPFRRTQEIVEFPDGGGTKPTVAYGSGTQPQKIASKRLFFDASGADLDLQGPWSDASVSYTENQVVLYGERLYKCILDHTSEAANTPGTSGGAEEWSALSAESLAGFCMEEATKDEMAQLLSMSLGAGRPERFRVVTNSSGQLVWYLDRDPDVTYYLRCEVLAALPDLATAANVDTAINMMPKHMHDILRTGVLEYVLAVYGRASASRSLMGKVEQQLDDLNERADQSDTDMVHSENHSSRTFNLMMDNGFLGGMSLGGGL